VRTSQLTALVRQEILDRVAKGDNNPGAWITERFSVTRRTASGWLSKLVADGALSASGSTRKSYLLGTKFKISFWVPLKNLDENQLWLDRVEPYTRSLPANVRGICQHGFTEMVNNAHDHSGGTKLRVSVVFNETDVTMFVLDDGVGIFKKIQDSLGLPDPRQSLLELSKGKFTSDPANHSGEGIFFSSRMFDLFLIVANDLAFTHNVARKNDVLLDFEDANPNGTGVLMKIARNSQRKTNDIFLQFAPADELSFDRTEIPMRMAKIGDENLVSRSQAKRVLQRFDRFKIVNLDFSGVTEIGQAFADEIFRVYARAHPGTEIGYTNATREVESMILRALNSDR
jgi:anti-sigma regulatory factor (Ser/Thr protein kinase)